jgi:hypothetical protein
MESLAIFLVILVFKPPSVISTVKNVTVFDKYVDFLVGHLSGEVMILQDSGNDYLATSIVDKINRQERTELVTIVDGNTKLNQMKCTRYSWFVTLHRADKKVSVYCVKIVVRNLLNNTLLLIKTFN